LVIGILLSFLLVSLFYILAAHLLPQAAVGATIALMGCIVIYFMYMWRAKPVAYDKELQQLRAVVNLSPLLNDVFFPFRGWAMEPEALVSILSFIQSNHCRVVVECGSGVSTILIGSLLKQQQTGHLYSLEEDEAWHRSISTVLAERNLEEFVTLACAPLRQSSNLGARAMWYAYDQAGTILDSVDHIDLLIVDGPKSAPDATRFPALPFFASLLDERSLVILDDARRSHEQMVLAKWQQDFDLQIDMRPGTSRSQAYVRLLPTDSMNGQLERLPINTHARCGGA
jgi:predicted O-methyltransferase YrrM